MSAEEKTLLEQAKDAYKAASEAFSEQRAEMEEDMRIYDGVGIWDDALRTARLNDPKGARPCLTISDIPPRVRQITNDVRQNKPAIKIRPVDSDADVETAEILGGIIRHIEGQSMADIAYEMANMYSAIQGVGYFRLVEGLSPEENQRELYIRPIFNTSSVVIDPASYCPVASTAKYAFVTEDIPRKEFEREYGDKEDVVGWNADNAEGVSVDDWITEDYVRIAEWMRLEEVKTPKEVQTATGIYPYDEKPDTDEIIETYYDRTLRCVWRKMIGTRILKTIELPISYIPVFRVPGEMYLKEGKVCMKGLVRDARDAVRMVSYTFSSYIESTTAQTKTPYIMAAGQDENYEKEWALANIQNASVLHYNQVDVDGAAAPPPRREPPPMASQGIIQGLVLAKQALKDVTGLGDASLGQKGNETSGKAILARQKEGDVSTYHYADNLSKAMRHMGRVAVQWLPHVYDERKVVRIIGEDGQTDSITLDPAQPEALTKTPYFDNNGQRKIKRIYNIGVGCYDVVATVGPSYSTKRVETVEMMQQLFQGAPGLIQLIGDIYLENQDGPGFDRMAKRLKAMLPPQVQQADAEDDQEDIPSHVIAQIQDMQAKLQEAGQIIEGLQGERERLEAEAQNKQGEIQAKLAAIEGKLQETKVKTTADVYQTQMEIDSREKIAGLQAQMDQMALTMQAFMQQQQAATDGASSGQDSKEE